MSDDREEFEDEMTVQPCTCRTPPREDSRGIWATDPARHEPGCAWRKQEERMAARKRERLDAEVAAHEGDDEPLYRGRPGEIEPYLVRHPEMLEDLTTIEIANLTDETVEYRVTSLEDPDTVVPGVDATTGLSMNGPIVEPAMAEGGPRFGTRLLRCLETAPWQGEQLLGTLRRQEIRSIAAAIDQDAHEQAFRLGAKRGLMPGDLRRKVEEAVERGRYSATVGLPPRRKNLLDAEPFLEEVARIFGERVESPAPEPRVNLLETGDATTWARQFIRLFGGRPGAIDEGLMIDWFANAIMVGWDKGRARLLEEQDRERSDHAEHESAHDRRERASARNEDSTGRVEGVDR